MSHSRAAVIVIPDRGRRPTALSSIGTDVGLRVLPLVTNNERKKVV